MSLLTILLQAAGGSQQWSGILMMVVIVAIFYFFMIRPQQKKQKEIQKSREALKTGDKVITAGGIYGKIKEIGDTYMLIEVADGVRIRVDKTSIFASNYRICHDLRTYKIPSSLSKQRLRLFSTETDGKRSWSFSFSPFWLSVSGYSKACSRNMR